MSKLNTTLVTVDVYDKDNVRTIGNLFHLAGCPVFEVDENWPKFSVTGRIANQEVDGLRRNISMINEQAKTQILEIT